MIMPAHNLQDVRLQVGRGQPSLNSLILHLYFGFPSIKDPVKRVHLEAIL